MPQKDPNADYRAMEKLAKGDESALEELYLRWSKPLLNFLYRMCLDRAQAEDLMQEVFVKIWRAAPRYEPRARFSTWMFQIARNHYLNEAEKRRRRLKPVSLDGAGRDGEEAGLHEAVAGDARSPADAVSDRETGQRIAEAVSRLPEKFQSVWELAVNQGLPYPDVAEVLSIPVGTVKSRMFQAVRLLRGALEGI